MYRLSVICCCFLYTSPCFAWWETGHRTVARLAAMHLTPAARIRVSRILGVPDTAAAVADALAEASTWADEVKAETNTGNWHFVDIALQDRRSRMTDRCEADNCVTARIRIFTSQLAGQQASGQWSEADALRFVVHLVGDVHQPLHSVSDADLGGNCELLDPSVGQAKNLHALWDGAIIEAMEESDETLASDLQKELAASGEPGAAAWSNGSPDDWAWESHELALKNVYGKLHIPVEQVIFPKKCAEAPEEITQFRPQVDNLYVDSMKPVVRRQLTKAGLRLARLLNEKF